MITDPPFPTHTHLPKALHKLGDVLGIERIQSIDGALGEPHQRARVFKLPIQQRAEHVDAHGAHIAALDAQQL